MYELPAVTVSLTPSGCEMESVGVVLSTAQLLPFHVVPVIQLPVAVVELSTVLLSLTCTVFEPFVIGYETPVPDAEVEYVFAVVAL